MSGSPVPSRSRSSAITSTAGVVVLDIGRIYTKIGLSGEPAPRHIIRSRVSMRPYGNLLDVWDPKYVGKEELYLILCRFVSDIYLRYLLVNPQEHRMVVVESLTSPTHFRNTLARVLFAHFNVPYVCFMPVHLACLFTIGKLTATVIDIGFKEATIIPVYEGVPFIKAWQSTSNAAEAIQQSLKELLVQKCEVKLLETGEVVPLSSNSGIRVDDALEDIVVRMCFVRPLDKEDDPPGATYPLSPIHSLHVSGYVRSRAADCLFDDSSSCLPLPVCVLDALKECPVDCRKELSENIIVVGGSTSLLGLCARLKEELVRLVGDGDYSYNVLSALSFKFHSPPSRPNCTSWLGASLLGACETSLLERSVSRDDFKENPSLPDWMSSNPQEWEYLRTVPVRKVPLVSSSRRTLPSTAAVAGGSPRLLRAAQHNQT